MSSRRPQEPSVRPSLDAAALRASLLAPAGSVTRVEVHGTDPSTNASLAAAVAADPEGWRPPAVLLADHQVAGRGRLGRGWSTPRGSALTMSLLVAPRARPLTWVPFLAGLAVVQAVGDLTGVEAGLKWPNDVLLAVPGAAELPVVGRRRKVAGILTEVVPGGVVVGIGLNVLQTADELPVSTATSLALAAPGSAVGRAELAVAVVTRFLGLLERWELERPGLREPGGPRGEIEAHMLTLGRRVRVERVEGEPVEGRAVGLDADGALLVAQTDGSRRTVRTGDVHHLRDLD